MSRLDSKTVEIIKKALNDEMKNIHYPDDIKKGLELAVKVVEWENGEE